MLFLVKINRDKSYRPEGWESTFLGILKDEMDYVRRVAVECCPKPLPDTFKKAISDRIRDVHVDVQIAALFLVRRESTSRVETRSSRNIRKGQRAVASNCCWQRRQ